MFLAKWFISHKLLLCRTSQRSARNQVPSQVATHQTIGSQLWGGEMPDLNPGLQDNSQGRYHWATMPPLYLPCPIVRYAMGTQVNLLQHLHQHFSLLFRPQTLYQIFKNIFRKFISRRFWTYFTFFLGPPWAEKTCLESGVTDPRGFSKVKTSWINVVTF